MRNSRNPSQPRGEKFRTCACNDRRRATDWTRGTGWRADHNPASSIGTSAAQDCARMFPIAGLSSKSGCTHAMHNRAHAVTCARILISLLPGLHGCGGAPHSPTGWPDHGGAAGAFGGSDAGAQPDSATPVAAPAPSEACELARAAPRSALDPAAFEETIQSARSQAGELRTAAFGERSELAAELLRRLALALIHAPHAAASDARRICELTKEADALASDGGKPFQGSAQIKRGLSAAVDLLDERVERADTTGLRSWLDAAHRAVQSIDERGMVAFQGAEIQDAFRTTVDALTVFAQRSRGEP
jgi:hypothetical protein